MDPSGPVPRPRDPLGPMLRRLEVWRLMAFVVMMILASAVALSSRYTEQAGTIHWSFPISWFLWVLAAALFVLLNWEGKSSRFVLYCVPHLIAIGATLWILWLLFPGFSDDSLPSVPLACDLGIFIGMAFHEMKTVIKASFLEILRGVLKHAGGNHDEGGENMGSDEEEFRPPSRPGAGRRRGRRRDIEDGRV